jgi:hypothetical protein
MNMSHTNATTGVASLGNTVGFSRGRKTTGEQVLGQEEKLGELVYKFNTKDQADMYLRTTEAIADFVGVEYGRDMRMLVKHGTEKTFTKPRIPRSDDTTPILMEKYKTELGIFHQDKKEFQDNKAKVFVIILEQCTHNVKSKLENELGYATLEMNDDVASWLFKAAKANGVCIRRGSTSILDTPDCYETSTSYQSRTKRVGYQLLQTICFYYRSH